MSAAVSADQRPEAMPQPAAPQPVQQGILALDGVGMRFGDVVALDGVTLTVMAGSILGIIGPSGAGKTTLIRTLTGALQPTRGQARVLGEDPRHFRRRTRERIGYMPQQFTLYPDLTAGENIDFVASLFGLLWWRRRHRVREVLKLVDLWDARNRRAGKLSGGMQRRLELACALVHQPALYFLDEPTAGIDPMLRSRIWEELHRLKDAGRTLLVTTQYLNEAEECDTVALIAEGRLIALGTPHELRREVSGGDVIELETREPFNPAGLATMPEVRSVSVTGPTVFRVVVDDAGAATPSVVETVGGAGGDVVAAREFQPSFDDVFAELVGRQRERRAAAEGDGEADRDDDDDAAKPPDSPDDVATTPRASQ